jgi:transposase
MNKRGDLVHLYGMIKEMYESGTEVRELVELLDVSRDTIYRALARMNVKMRLSTRRKNEEEKLVYVVEKPVVLEKVTVNGKVYTDITPLFSPR